IPHTISECFNVLTYRLRLSAGQVRETMRINLQRFRFVLLDPEDHWIAMDRLIEKGMAGDKIYDALHVRGAHKDRASKIFTSNRRDFASLTDIPIERIGSEQPPA
ncbi:MAG: hypothetical protein ACREFR_10975, partial [Limisphaerales bacterium]